jgi:hypothetical protein
MIPFLPGSRRRAADTDGHIRARTLLAERLDAEIADSDAAWLSNHLITCADCSGAEAAYAEQRALLRGLAEPVPPRDLWARTSAKIELESGWLGRPLAAPVDRPARRPPGARRGRRGGRVAPLATIVGPALSGSLQPLPSFAAASVEPRAADRGRAGEVGWALKNDDGS